MNDIRDYTFFLTGYLLIITVVLTLCVPVLANDEWSEEFIEFALGGKRGDRFYPVMMNEDEEPYLEVSDVFNNWIEMEGDCDIAHKHCQGSLPWLDTIYWLNLEDWQAGSNIQGSKTLLLNKNDAIIKDNKIWIKYSILPKWLPVNINWTHYRYALSITTNYTSLKERKKQRAKSRENFQKQWLQYQRIANTTAQEAKQEYGTELRLGARIEYQDQFNEYHYANLMSDLYKGTLTFNASTDAIQSLPKIDSYHYENFYIPYLYRLSLGYIQSSGSHIVPAFSLVNGVSIRSHEGVQGSGKFEYWDMLKPFTEVDVFQNSFIIDSKITDKSGAYHLDEVEASGGDMFSLNFYYPDGKEETKTIIIAPDRGLLISRGEFNYQAAIGESQEGFLNQGAIRYGLIDSVSLGAHWYYLGNESQAYGADFSWRLIDSLNIHYEAIFLGNTTLSNLSADYLGFSGQQYGLTFEKTLKGTALQSQPLVKKSFDSGLMKFRHNINLKGYYVSTNIEYIRQETRLFQEVSTRLHRNISAKLINVLVDNNSGSRWNSAFLTSMNWKNQKLQTMTSLNNLDYSVSGQFRYPYTLDANWHVKYGFNYSSGNHFTHKVSAMWYPSHSMSIAASYDGELYSLNLRLEHVVTHLKKGLAAEYFSSGRIYGRILSPVNEEGIEEPLVDVRVFAGSRSALTDAKGYFVMDGLATHQKLVFDIDKNTLDIDYTVSNKIVAFVLRPGSRLEINPDIVSSVGVDGVYLTYEKIGMDATISMINQDTGAVVAEGPVETDGFFLLEQLSPGTYNVKVNGVKYAPEMLKIDIPIGTDWLGGIEIKGTDYKA